MDVKDFIFYKKVCGINFGGVCFYVNNGKVLLELCVKCEKRVL